MKCKNCGNPRVTYVDSRKKLWGQKKGAEKTKEPRKNWKVKCKKCGAEYEEEHEEGQTTPVEETKVPNLYIICNKTGQKMIRDGSCAFFAPLKDSEKKRCWNCQFAEEE